MVFKTVAEVGQVKHGSIQNPTYSLLSQRESSLQRYRRNHHHDNIQPQTGQIYPPNHLKKEKYFYNYSTLINACVLMYVMMSSVVLTGFPNR